METEPPPSSNQENAVEEPSPVLEERVTKVRRAKSSRSQHRRPRGTRSSHKRRRPITSIDEGPFSNRAVRTLFFRKLYLTATLQLGLTLGIICMFVYWKYVKIWVRRRPWFCYTMLPAIVLLAITIACFDQVRRHFPLDIIMLLIFTICEGMLLGSIAAFFEADAVMWSVGATVSMTFGLSAFTLQNKCDITITSGILLILALLLVVYGCFCAILQSMWLRIIHAAVGTLIFSIYLLVDTQLMLGKKDQDNLNPDEYIFAALNIYIDIFSFFIFILQFVGWRK